jgi:hypothetical protein
LLSGNGQRSRRCKAIGIDKEEEVRREYGDISPKLYIDKSLKPFTIIA